MSLRLAKTPTHNTENDEFDRRKPQIVTPWNDKGVLLKLVWNKRGRSKNWLRPRLNHSEDPTPGRDPDSCSSGEDKLSVASYKTNKDGSQKVQKRVKVSHQVNSKRSRQFRAKRRLFEEEGLKQEMQEEAERVTPDMGFF